MNQTSTKLTLNPSLCDTYYHNSCQASEPTSIVGDGNAVAQNCRNHNDDDKILLVQFFCTYVYLCFLIQRASRSILSFTYKEIRLALQRTFSPFCEVPFKADNTNLPSGYLEPDGAQSITSSPAAARRRSKQRGRKDDDKRDRDKNPRPSRASAKIDGREPPQPFACPYCSADCMGNLTCLRVVLSRIVDVRLHIARKHQQRPHCPTCGLFFDNDVHGSELNRHIAGRSCQEQVYYLPGASPDQLDAISRAGGNRATRTDPDRWYEIWDICFPGRQRPNTVFAPPPEYETYLRVLEGSQLFLGSSNMAELFEESVLPSDANNQLREASRQNITTTLNRFVQFMSQISNAPAPTRPEPSGAIANTEGINATQTPQDPTQSQAQPPSLVGSGEDTLSSNTSASRALNPGPWVPANVAPRFPSQSFCQALASSSTEVPRVLNNQGDQGQYFCNPFTAFTEGVEPDLFAENDENVTRCEGAGRNIDQRRRGQGGHRS